MKIIIAIKVCVRSFLLLPKSPVGTGDGQLNWFRISISTPLRAWKDVIFYHFGFSQTAFWAKAQF